mmetsp:Transcript_4084/g.13296  ORF Transcript_4084/g.13296 Transcript_4084/m.13296 type:complete len:340 (+) Transcript_4084:822-1841(+)
MQRRLRARKLRRWLRLRLRLSGSALRPRLPSVASARRSARRVRLPASLPRPARPRLSSVPTLCLRTGRRRSFSLRLPRLPPRPSVSRPSLTRSARPSPRRPSVTRSSSRTLTTWSERVAGKNCRCSSRMLASATVPMWSTRLRWQRRLLAPPRLPTPRPWLRRSASKAFAPLLSGTARSWWPTARQPLRHARPSATLRFAAWSRRSVLRCCSRRQRPRRPQPQSARLRRVVPRRRRSRLPGRRRPVLWQRMHERRLTGTRHNRADKLERTSRPRHDRVAAARTDRRAPVVVLPLALRRRLVVRTCRGAALLHPHRLPLRRLPARHPPSFRRSLAAGVNA